MCKLIIIIQIVLFTCVKSSSAFDYDIDISPTYFNQHIDLAENKKEVAVVKIPEGTTVGKIILKGVENDTDSMQTRKHCIKPKNLIFETEDSDSKTVENETFGDEKNIARTYDENTIKIGEPDLNNFESNNINSIKVSDTEADEFESFEPKDADKKATNLRKDKENYSMQRNEEAFIRVVKPIHYSEKDIKQNNGIRKNVISHDTDIKDSAGRNKDQNDNNTTKLHEILSTIFDVEPTDDDMNDLEPTGAEVFDTTYSDGTGSDVTDTKSKFALSTEKYMRPHSTFKDSEEAEYDTQTNAPVSKITNIGRSWITYTKNAKGRTESEEIYSPNSTEASTRHEVTRHFEKHEAEYDTKTNAPVSKITNVGRSWITYTKNANGTTESEEIYETHSLFRKPDDMSNKTLAPSNILKSLKYHLYSEGISLEIDESLSTVPDGDERQAETGRRKLKQESGVSKKFTEAAPVSKRTEKTQDVSHAQDTHAVERDPDHRSKLNNFSFAVSIQRKGAHYATGALVDKRWILSVAKEFYYTRESIKLFRAKLGSVNNKKGGVLLPLSRIEVHPAYKFGSPNHDLALLRLAHSVHHAVSIRPVRLLNLESNLVSGVFTTIYWPRLLVNGNLLDSNAKERVHHHSLRISKQFSIDWEKCQKLVSLLNHNITLKKSTWCLRPVVTHHSSCMPDPGAPVLSEHGLWGITSGWTSEDCLNKHSPTVFTRVSAPEVRVWLEKQMHRTTDMRTI